MPPGHVVTTSILKNKSILTNFLMYRTNRINPAGPQTGFISLLFCVFLVWYYASDGKIWILRLFDPRPVFFRRFFTRVARPQRGTSVTDQQLRGAIVWNDFLFFVFSSDSFVIYILTTRTAFCATHTHTTH